ncbi:MAG: hypothetical protein JSS32_10170 [Verrucomicrobia bacterium]|nr:hypothetical protein [Verrucomicrobiota bacterium]
MRYLLIVFWISSLWAADYDVAIVGTSPFSLLEALYRYHLGEKVLVVEQDDICGGAWRSIDVCGIEQVDLGCHQIGHDAQLLHFLEEYVGCKMVSLDNPLAAYTSTSANGYYFSGGCRELISQLMNLIGKTGIDLWMNTTLETAKIDPIESIAHLRLGEKTVTASRLVVPYYASFKFENLSLERQSTPVSKYPHLYLLIEDTSYPRFSYQCSIGPGFSRMMNLTHFAGMVGTGQQLIVFQTHSPLTFETGESFVGLLKERGYLNDSAKLLMADAYVFEQSYFNRGFLQQIPQGNVIVETLDTSHIQNLTRYVSKWKMVLKPYKEAMQS